MNKKRFAKKREISDQKKERGRHAGPKRGSLPLKEGDLTRTRTGLSMLCVWVYAGALQ